jgi:hypothetical protein
VFTVRLKSLFEPLRQRRIRREVRLGGATFLLLYFCFSNPITLRSKGKHRDAQSLVLQLDELLPRVALKPLCVLRSGRHAFFDSQA